MAGLSYPRILLLSYTFVLLRLCSGLPVDGGSPEQRPRRPGSADYCVGTRFNASLLGTYVCGDERLGPAQLPVRGVVADMLDTYDRFGGLAPGDFLRQWYNESQNTWWYPGNALPLYNDKPSDGFAIDVNGAPIVGKVNLEVGTLIDRFGSEHGRYASPYAAPYDQRAIPPQSLNERNISYPYNYHVYRVAQQVQVSLGPILPWFNQEGQGVQLEFAEKLVTLLGIGVLVEVMDFD